MDDKSILIAGAGRAAADAGRALAREGHAVEPVPDAAVALARLAERRFDLALLAGGCASARLRLCAAIRRQCGELPILLLGATPQELAQLGDARGPDDWVVRELDEAEVCSRVRSLLRRSARSARGATAPSHACGPLRIDPAARRVGFSGRWVELTAIEFELLRHLADSPERAISREELLRAVWGYQHDGYSHTLTTHVNRLRSKLERELGAPRVLQTVRGLGYRIAPDA